MPDTWPSLVDFKIMILGEKGRVGAEGDQQGVDIAGEKFSWPFVLGLQQVYGKYSGFFKEPIVYFIDYIRDKEVVEFMIR